LRERAEEWKDASQTKGGMRVLSSYTAEYTRLRLGYMGQLVEWPEVVTEGKTLEECRAMLLDALREMVLAYREQKKEIPLEKGGRATASSADSIEGE
jgi:predicted RNase H-like HicB family nuclease